MDEKSNRITNRGNADQRQQRLLFDCTTHIFASTRASIINRLAGVTRLMAHSLRGVAHRRARPVGKVRRLIGDSIDCVAKLILGCAVLALNFPPGLVDLPFRLQAGIPGQAAGRVFDFPTASRATPLISSSFITFS